MMGLVTTFLFYNYMETLKKETLVNNEMVQILVAKDMIRKNQKISKEMITFSKVPKNGIHPQSIKNISEAEGLYTTSDIAKDEPLLKHRLKSVEEEKLFVSRKIREGYRGVSIGVNLVESVSNLIEPGDTVDVVFSQTSDSKKEPPIIQTDLLLQGVRVLAVGRRMIEITPEDPYEEYVSVTLELKGEDGLKLIHASERGSIQLMLHDQLIPPKGEPKND